MPLVNISEIQQCVPPDRSTVQLPQAMAEQTALLVPCNAADTHTHPSVLLKTVFHEREGLQQQHFIYSFVQHKLFFSTTVVAQGAFQAWLEKLTSWYSQKQLAGRKATPARYTAGKFFAWVSLTCQVGP